MSPDPELAAAKLRAEQARLRLMGATHELQARVAPRRIAADAIENAKVRGQEAAGQMSALARRKPGLVTGVAIGLLALLARRRIARLFRRKRDTITIPASRTRALPRPKGD